MLGDVLEHHGVKGQKWGVRKDTGHEGETAKTSKISKLDNKFEKQAGRMNTKIDLHNYAAHHMNTHELHRINSKKEYAGKDLTANPKLAAKYENELQSTYLKHLQDAANLSTNASGTKKYAIEANANGNGWHVKTVDVEHDVDSGYHVPIKRGPKGHALSLGDASVKSSMAQGEILIANVLAHHGVLGMKWGNRKGSSSSSGSKSSSTSHVSEDHVLAEHHKATIKEQGVKALSNNDLKKLNERMQLEQTYNNLKGQKPSKFESGHSKVQQVLKVGKTLNDIHNTLNGPAGKLAKTAIKNASKAAKVVEAVTEE